MKEAIAAFFRAVGWGTLAGGAPYTVLLMIPLVMSSLDYRSLANIALVLAYPLILSGAFVLGSALVFGLPLTAVLSRRGRDHGGSYAIAGLVLGTLVSSMIHLGLAREINAETLFFALPGAFAGLVTGTSWGRWRERRQVDQGRLG
ncbi:MAG: hypothetical protein KAF27_12410 [Porphyrobacter sp.]|nr:hypothetical protein [Porphyrobacter sp.]